MLSNGLGCLHLCLMASPTSEGILAPAMVQNKAFLDVWKCNLEPQLVLLAFCSPGSCAVSALRQVYSIMRKPPNLTTQVLHTCHGCRYPCSCIRLPVASSRTSGDFLLVLPGTAAELQYTRVSVWQTPRVQKARASRGRIMAASYTGLRYRAVRLKAGAPAAMRINKLSSCEREHHASKPDSNFWQCRT